MEHNNSINLFDHNTIKDFIDKILINENRERFGDTYDIRQDFPILKRIVNGYPISWLDNGATSQKCKQVIDSMTYYYHVYNSNIHRSSHTLAREATAKVEQTRSLVPAFLGSKVEGDVVFTRGTTDSINIVVGSLERSGYFKEGDVIVVSEAEHHSNFVPWQQLAKRLKLIFKVIPIDKISGEVDVNLLDVSDISMSDVKMIALTHVSNVTGKITPVMNIINFFSLSKALILIDGAQSVPHFMPSDIIDIVDFYVFSSHKMYGPTGVGILYTKPGLLDDFEPFHMGGQMIDQVSIERSTFKKSPLKFEAGTHSIAEIVGLGEAIEYLNSVNRPKYMAIEDEITKYLYNRLSLEIPGIKILGTLPNRIGVIAFELEGHDVFNLANFLDGHGIACRVGNHCSAPIHQAFGIENSLRVSLGIYNNMREAEQLMIYLKQYFDETPIESKQPTQDVYKNDHSIYQDEHILEKLSY